MMATNRTLLEQARELQALAQTGLMYCKDPFDRERYERIRAMAGRPCSPRRLMRRPDR